MFVMKLVAFVPIHKFHQATNVPRSDVLFDVAVVRYWILERARPAKVLSSCETTRSFIADST